MALILSGDTGPSFVQSAAQPTGSVLQVVYGSNTTETYFTAGSYVTTGLNAAITPRSTTSKILVLADMQYYGPGGQVCGLGFAVYRGATQVWADVHTYDSFYMNSTPSNGFRTRAPIYYLDSPSTTSSTTYSIYANAYTGTVAVNQANAMSTIVLMEVQG